MPKTSIFLKKVILEEKFESGKTPFRDLSMISIKRIRIVQIKNRAKMNQVPFNEVLEFQQKNQKSHL